MKPLEIAQSIYAEMQKSVPSRGKVEDLTEDLVDLVGRDEAMRLVTQAAGKSPTIH